MGTTLVTGGAGFIGSNFVELLWDMCPDEKIIVLDVFTYAANPDNIPDLIKRDPRFRLVRGNIRDAKVVGELVKEADQVVHFAAESHVTRSIADDVPFFETDVLGTQTIAAAISRNRDRVKKFVHISTSEVYGTAVEDPMSETHPLNPCTPYAAAKAGADRLVYAYRETYGIPTVIIRPFNNYGPKQHLEKVVPRFITSALLGEPLLVHGDGQMTRDWIFVEDTCEAVLRALEEPLALGEVINVGTGLDVSVQTIAEQILELCGQPRSLIEHVSPRPGQVDRHIASTKKAWSLLDWVAEVKLNDGLRRTVDWYKANTAWWARQRNVAQISITDGERRLTGSY
jgi:dTDP-glucose 4,6-dehydratase